MMKGDISPAIKLDSLQTKNLYALGAYGELQGEILILDGKSFGTRYVDGDIIIDNDTSTDTTSLLAYAYVDGRRSYDINSGLSGEILEKEIQRIAKEHGINTTQPFVYRLTGEVSLVLYHIIDRDPNDSAHTHEKHMEAGHQGQLNNENVEILGFYSESHQGVFTHHSSFLHAHVWSEGLQTGGHIDELVTGKMLILLPSL